MQSPQPMSRSGVERLELQVAGEALDDELVELVGHEGEILLGCLGLQRDEEASNFWPLPPDVACKV